LKGEGTTTGQVNSRHWIVSRDILVSLTAVAGTDDAISSLSLRQGIMMA
jgi:hypothetical protein